jgi:NAD/NADP transhydrogenase alpha subunit
MLASKRIERRSRGFFGWIFLILFLGFNALMLFAVVSGLAATSEVTQGLATEAEQAGAAIGTALGLGVILIFWAAGAVILGLLALLTRGNTTVVETHE